MTAVLGEIKDGASNQDKDKIEAIFSEMEEYTIPQECFNRWEDIKKAAEAFDYEKIISLCE